VAVACTGCKNILFQTPSLLFYLDYEKVLELEPDNFEATNELRKINQVNYNHLSALGLSFMSWR
jgi:hypothetical protein